MIKFVCDRCGCEVRMTVIPFNRKAIVIDGVNRREYDLCKKCISEVREFITGQTERSE
jgi:hypothetical protein